MNGYKGYFTVNNNGSDIPAELWIYDDSGLMTGNLVFASDPCVLDWGKVDLITDSMHYAQLEVSLIAEGDADYRDIKDSSTTVYCKLVINGSVFWRGALASRTWDEPFSRLERYKVTLTFSDFNYLKRIYFNYSMLSESDKYSVDIRTLLSQSILKITPDDPELLFHDMPDTKISLAYDFSQNIVHTSNFFSDTEKENGLPLFEIIDEILKGAGVHIIQYNGKWILFKPDYFTFNQLSKSLSASLSGKATDSQLSSADLFGKITLKYAIGSNKAIAIADSLEFLKIYRKCGYPVYYVYTNTQTSEQVATYCLSSEVIKENYKGLYCCFLDYYESKSESCKLLIAPYNSDFRGVVGLYNYGRYLRDNQSEFIDLSAKGKITSLYSLRSHVSNAAAEYEDGITLSLDLLVSAGDPLGRCYNSENSEFIKAVEYLGVKAIVEYVVGSKTYRLISADGYFSSNSWKETFTDSDCCRLWLKKPMQSSGFISAKLSKIHLPDNTTPGTITVTVYPGNVVLRSAKDEAVTSTDVYNYIQWYGFRNLQILSEGPAVDLIPDEIELEETINTIDSEELSVDFKFGTPDYCTYGTHTAYSTPGGLSTIPQKKSYLNRYLEFLKRNLTIKAGKRNRWTIKGTYSYDHLLSKDLPVFVAKTALPLKTLQNDDFAFFLRAEEWHLRSGRCDLTLEEMNVVEFDPGNMSLKVSPASINVNGSKQELAFAITTNYAWNIVLDNTAMAHLQEWPEGSQSTEKHILIFENTSNSARTCIVTVTATDGIDTVSGTLTITQAVNSIKLSAYSEDETSAAGGTNIAVTSASKWTAVSDSAWAVVSMDGQDSFDIDYEKNIGEDRSAKITVTNESGDSSIFTLNQKGGALYVSVSPTDTAIDKTEQDTEYINVVTNDTSWSVTSINVGWATSKGVEASRFLIHCTREH
jgi:hypothetical protein